MSGAVNGFTDDIVHFNPSGVGSYFSNKPAVPGVVLSYWLKSYWKAPPPLLPGEIAWGTRKCKENTFLHPSPLNIVCSLSPRSLSICQRWRKGNHSVAGQFSVFPGRGVGSWENYIPPLSLQDLGSLIPLGSSVYFLLILFFPIMTSLWMGGKGN